MCGIVGYLDRTGNGAAPVGRHLLGMLGPLDCRGPDSAGVALYGGGAAGNGRNGNGTGNGAPSPLTLRVKLGERGDHQERGARVADAVRQWATVHEAATTEAYLRLVIDDPGDPRDLERRLEQIEAGIELVSLGRRLELVKQVGSPANLDSSYGIAAFTGSHGIGHTRLSTESRIDLSHSQPFWAHGHPDLAIVHNGHITNYHKLRRRYEQRGVRFYTDNDSEIIGVFIGQRLAGGMTLAEALQAALTDLDGSFSCLVATADALGLVKDRYAFKPLLLAENDAMVAVATEEVAIRAALDGQLDVREAQAGAVMVWQR